MLGKLFRTVREIATLPIEVVKDVATLGTKKAMDGKFYTQDKLDKIEDDLDDIV
jgi:hypothetical protein